MNNENNILGCFISVTHPTPTSDQHIRQSAEEHGKLFRSYIYGLGKLSDIIKKLKRENYGKDVELILFKFYVNALPTQIEALDKMRIYRKIEKAMDVAIYVNEENFFSKSEEERHLFLKQSLFLKLDLLTEIVKKKKLDTNMGLLKWDLEELLDGY